MQTPLVAVYVGATRKKIEIPGNLLCFHSKFFRMALNGGFKEAANYSVDLPEDEPKLFQVIVDWMYEHGKPLNILDKHVAIHKKNPQYDGPLNCARELCALAYMADKLDIERLQRSIICEFISTVDWTWDDYHHFPFDAALLAEVYENTPESSFLRLFIASEICPLLNKDVPHSQSLLEEFEPCFKQIPDLAWDVITSFSGWQPSPRRAISGRGRLSDSMSQELVDFPLGSMGRELASRR